MGDTKLTMEWSEYDQDYEKKVQDIRLKNGDEVLECWPNAGKWMCLSANEKYGKVYIQDADVTHTRLSLEKYSELEPDMPFQAESIVYRAAPQLLHSFGSSFTCKGKHQYREVKETKDDGFIAVNWVCECGRNMND